MYECKYCQREFQTLRGLQVHNYQHDGLLMTPIKEQISQLLKKNEGFGYTRSYIMNKLKCKRTTIYDNLETLEKFKIVERITLNNHKRGRPNILWRLVEK